MMEYLCWLIGCSNISLSLMFQAIGYHSKSLDQVAKDSIMRAVNVQQIASLGFILLSLKGAPILPTVILSVATFLFPGVLYYQAIQGQRNSFSKFVPIGGGLHMVFWALFGLFYFSDKPFLE